jgi:Hpt domain.
MEFKELLDKLNVDAEVLLRRFSGNEGLTKRFLLKFPEDKTYEGLKEGVLAADNATILAKAHALKGIALNLGLDSLGNQSSDLVEYLRAGETADVSAMFDGIASEYARVYEIITDYNN